MEAFIETHRHFLIFVYLFIHQVDCQSSCIDGTIRDLGTLFDPYNKFQLDKSSISYPEEEIVSMLDVVSKRFHRITSYGNANPNEASSRTAVAAARVNSMQKRLAISVNTAVYQNENEIEFNKDVDFLLQSVQEANGIFNGTVTGIIVTSGYFLSDKSHNLRRMLKYVSEHSLRNSIPLGVRANNCDDIDSWVRMKHETTLEILNLLGFVICHILPTPRATPELSADSIIDYLKRIVEMRRITHLKLIAQTGWPSEGRTRENIEGSVEAMNRFWCRMVRLINESVALDLFSAFDEPWKKDHMDFPATAEAHYGWWVRVGNDSSGPNDFEEKINYHPVQTTTSNSLEITLWVLGTVLILGLVLVVGFLYVKLRVAQDQLLSNKDIEEFEKGRRDVGESDGNQTEDALLLPYDRSYEISKTNFYIDGATLLGKGAFGCVYRGKLSGIENDVAFKMTQSNCTATTLKSLLSEIKIMIHVGKHPNVVSIIGAYTGELKRGRILIATELCENGSLEAYLRSKKETMGSRIYVNSPSDERQRLPEAISAELDNLAKWAYQIANGMEHIASRNIIHSDLATRNVLLTANSIAKITDFGLSRRLYEYTNYVKQNQEPLPWRWMALESLEQMKFSTKSDVWSYGVTLFEIFSLGDVPYPGLSWNIDFTRDLRKGLRLTRPELANELTYEIMTKCWCADPKDRPDFSALKESVLKSIGEREDMSKENASSYENIAK